MGLFDGWRRRVADLEARVAAVEAANRAMGVELAEYLDRFTRLYKRTDQRARVLEKREAQIEIPEVEPEPEESTMSMRQRFGR